MDKREELVRHWLVKTIQPPFTIKPLSGDASFRQYSQIQTQKQSYVLMDAPPKQEDCRPFVSINTLLSEHNIAVPKIYAADLSLGLLLLEDFGDALLLSQLNQNNADDLYQTVIRTLLRMQTINCQQLPRFDEQQLMGEMQLFSDWYCQRHLNFTLSPQQQKEFKQVAATLIDNATSQPQVFVHRDYHSKNLMLIDDNKIGVLDYQDAVAGALSYDLVSLLRDCYIRWSDEQVECWIGYFLSHCPRQDYPEFSNAQFRRWFDWMGVQRHLKAIGIFARLCHRDNKPTYLSDIPLTMSYLKDCTARYFELAALHDLLTQLPEMP